MLQLTTKLMNKFSYSITTHFIPGNKDYHSCCNPHSVYQTYPKEKEKKKKKGWGCLFYASICTWVYIIFDGDDEITSPRWS